MNPLEEFIREITQELDIPLRPWCPGSSSLSSQQQGECDHRHEDVAGLATLKKGSNAREQFAALALLSHPRCGSVANQRKMVPTVVTSTGEKRSSKKNKGGKKSKHTRTEQIRATEEHGDSVAQVGDGEGGMMSVDWPVLLRTLWEWCVDRHTRAFYWVVAADDGNVLTTFSVCTATMGVVREAEGWWCGSGATHCLISGNRDVRSDICATVQQVHREGSQPDTFWNE
ncbi:hypothetical protein Pelo_8225 [Pelomyxa schiedti]|nr:hypothetical protein Pelo_8225 [Pelomyxa schiedti]